MDRFLKTFLLCKVDIPQRIVYGLVTAEREDKDGETCHYESTVPYYKAINDEMGKATDGANIMPLREMHQLHAVGAGKSIEFDDGKKEIKMSFKVVEDSTWKKVLEKVLTGFSQGGKYIKQWKENGKIYYTAEPGEVSLVDNPCLAGAVIEYVKADGSIEAYKVPDPPIVRLTDGDIERIAKALGDSLLGTGSDESGASILERVRKLNASKGGDMNKEQIKKCAAALGISEEEFVKQFVEGDALEKGKKGLAALHAHLKKAHAHHKMMKAHHDKIGEMHKAHAEHHDTMAGHLENAMKAHAACSDDGDSEKTLKDVLKALSIESAELVLIGKTSDGVEIFRKAGSAEVKLEGLTAPAAAAADVLKAADVSKLISEALEKQKKEFDAQLEKTLAPSNGGTGVRMALIGRDGKEITKSEGATQPGVNPIPV